MRLGAWSKLRVLLLATAVLTAGVAGAGTRPERCRSAEYALSGTAVGTGTMTSATVEVGPLVGVGVVCPLAPPKVRRATTAGETIVRAR
jgi:hypothetical protein